MAIFESIMARMGRGAPEAAVAEASRVPYALRFSKFRSEDEFRAAGEELGRRFGAAQTEAERAAIKKEIDALQNSFLKFTGEKPPTGAAFGSGPISANERMVLQSKYGQERVLDPRTGYPQSAGGQPLRYDYTDPFEQMGKRLGQLEGNEARSPSGINYLFEKSRAMSPDGYPMSVRGPGGQMQKLEGFTPGQRLAQVGAAAPVVGALGASAMRDREAPLSSYTGDAVDAEAYMANPRGGASAPMPAATPPAQFMPQYSIAQFTPSINRTYTGDDVDAAALVRKHGTPASAARPAVAAPATAERPAQVREEPGFLSRAMSKIYDPKYLEDKSSRELYQMAKDMQSSGDEYGSHLMTGRAMSMDRASGGATNAKPPKDAALHKALEIIQLMLSRR